MYSLRSILGVQTVSLADDACLRVPTVHGIVSLRGGRPQTALIVLASNEILVYILPLGMASGAPDRRDCVEFG